ncbi:MAG: hypothetical protein M5U29_08505 [Anaerolineae bacterium]|nr:hypothetical protein [Anaerolineae bacterium]
MSTPDHLPAGGDHARGDQAVEPRPATDIYHALARLQQAEAERVARPGERLKRAFWNVFEPFLLVAQLAGQG